MNPYDRSESCAAVDQTATIDSSLKAAPSWQELCGQLPDGILGLDAEGRVRYANAAAIGMLCLDENDLAGGLFGYPLLEGEQEISIPTGRDEGRQARLRMYAIDWGGERGWLAWLRPRQAAAAESSGGGHRLAYTLIQQVPLAIIVIDPKLRVMVWNPAASAMLGWEDYEVLGQPLPGLAQDNPHSLLNLVQAALDNRPRLAHELIGLVRRDGCPIEVQAWSHLLRDRFGEIQGVVVILHELSRRRQLSQEGLPGQDPLTGLMDRQHFRKALRRLLAARRHEGVHAPLLLLKLDIDRFKNINHALGQNGGDHLLKQVAQRLADQLYESDLIARTGSDEFSILLNNARQWQDGVRVAERLQDLFSEPFLHGAECYFLSASIGIAVYPRDARKANALLDAAERALAQAKQLGGGSIAHFTPADDAQARNLLALESKLRQAAVQHELHLFYQPQFDLATGRLRGVEALLRWQHPTLGMVPPAEFIPLAESSGIIHAIGSWVMREACRQLRSWQTQAIPIRLAINLSPRQLQRHELVDEIAAIIRATEVDPAGLELELTESCLLRNLEEALRVLKRLKALGVRLAIDDFGTGYSNLAYLAALPFDTLKIDRSFVHKLSTEPRIGAIIETIGNLGRGLGLNVIAEGIETEEQLAFMRRIHCHEVQGYLLARPMPADDLAGFLAGQPAPFWGSS